jgi:endonuclease/exonuclease/phosphatase family metal-dependent hydrolase
MQLRVATWNIWGRYGDYRARYHDIVSVLRTESADLVGLVEIWHGEDEDQLEQLAGDLGYTYWASADVGITDGVYWGVGVLSRLPIVREDRLVFPSAFEGQPPGVALVATVECPAGEFDFVSLCEWPLLWSALGVTASSSRLESFHELARKLSEPARPITPIVVGDFNTIPESQEIRVLTGKEPSHGLAMSFRDTWEILHGTAEGWTSDGVTNPHLKDRPRGRHRIDYILTGTGPEFAHVWGTTDVVVFGTGEESPPSDHYGVRADLQLVGPVIPPSDNHIIER